MTTSGPLSVNEPRGSDVIVGALLCEPLDVNSAAAVIFFNNVGYLGMCGHGTIGVIATLQFLNRIGPGEHKIETPVGTVSAVLHDDRQVTVITSRVFGVLPMLRSSWLNTARSVGMLRGEGTGFFWCAITVRSDSRQTRWVDRFHLGDTSGSSP